MRERNRVYIDIQSLLELRQSVLVQMMGEKEAIAFINSDAYISRELDVFPVDMEEYTRLLQDYRVALPKSTVTYIEVVLKSKIASMEKLNAFNSESCDTEIVLNIYPYNLPTVVAESIRDALFIKLNEPTFISVVNEPHTVFTPLHLKQNRYKEFFCYDVTGWMGANLEALSKQRLEDTRLYFPTLGKKEITDKDLKDVKKLGFTDIYHYTEFILSGAAKITFLPVGLYSNIFVGMGLLEKTAEIESAILAKNKEELNVDIFNKS